MSEPTVVVGKITRAHGLKGEVGVLVLSDNPERFIAGSTVFREDGREMRVRSSRANGGRLLVTFEGRAAGDAYGFLAERGINAPAGSFYALEASRRLGLGDDGGLRIGLAPYSNAEDVARLLAGLYAFLT